MKKAATKVDLVYDYLLHEILSGCYANGSHILIQDVAQACSVSPTPVREALRRLESNSYVRILPNQGAVSVALNKESILHTFEIKGVLEGYAARVSIDYLSPHDYRVLTDLNECMLQAAEQQDFKQYSKLNIDFHMYMSERCPLPELVTMIREQWRKWSVTKDVFFTAPERMEESYQEHKQIIELARSHNYEGLESFIRMHKANAARRMVAQLSKEKDGSRSAEEAEGIAQRMASGCAGSD